MSKRLKRRIQDICGFKNLDRKEKIARATEILNSTELKQHICHEILGATHKDVERAMRGILNERNFSEEEVAELEERATSPEKFEPQFDPEFEFKVNRPKETAAPSYLTREQTALLLKASRQDYSPVEPEWPAKKYPPLERETAQRLVREHFEYIAKQKAKHQEADKSLDMVMATRITEKKEEPKSKKKNK